MAPQVGAGLPSPDREALTQDLTALRQKILGAFDSGGGRILAQERQELVSLVPSPNEVLGSKGRASAKLLALRPRLRAELQRARQIRQDPTLGDASLREDAKRAEEELSEVLSLLEINNGALAGMDEGEAQTFVSSLTPETVRELDAQTINQVLGSLDAQWVRQNLAPTEVGQVMLQIGRGGAQNRQQPGGTRGGPQ